MSKQARLVVVIILAVLTGLSGVLFLVAVTAQGTGYNPSKVNLDVKLITRDEIVTAAYKTYGDDSQNMWVAKTIIKNVGRMPVYDFKIAYKVGDLTDWTSGEEYQEIRPGQTVRDYCWPNLDEGQVRAITTKTPVELVMKYEYRGLDKPYQDFQKIFLLGRNDFVFSSLPEESRVTFSDHYDNYRFIAAFITPNENATKSFANNVGGGLETRVSDEDALEAFRRCFNMLRAHGVKYIMEPEAFWAGSAAQYVQYPSETIERRSGTCLDLAIVMSAIMEAIGVKSYVALIPGHAIPLVTLPESGDLYAIESTFMDRDYAVAKYGDTVSPDVSADECISVASESINGAQDEGEIIMIDPGYWWKAGVMPAW